MDEWVIWVILAVVFGAGEIVTTSFFLAPFAGGAAVAAIAAGVGVGFGASAAIFILVSVLLLLFVRPIARAHLKTPAQLRTGTAALVGRRAMVLERISNDEAVGCVRIDGEVWTARAYDDDDIIEAGRPVTVVEIRGATALVSE
ncbi:NfeD family protein [Conexibacter sp. CPCC 206217]|uniref:NfeD family protein n=1 Tax=Conexibacter sp. CPCC 206217 TaxID=3064574 RepID=UPI002718A2C0|nr:NfeD family protein [Conexibacter sp. CPCC 206217]MDO8212793.1 NfeD family protein [Conexibacter sp. CPCC 206217]